MTKVVFFRHGDYDFEECLTSYSKRLIAKKIDELLKSGLFVSKEIVLLTSPARRALNSTEVIKEELVKNGFKTDTRVEKSLFSEDWRHVNSSTKSNLRQTLENIVNKHIIVVTHFEWTCYFRESARPLDKGNFELIEKDRLLERLQ